MNEPRKNRILMVVASKHGSTSEIAEAIEQELKTASFEVDYQDLRYYADVDKWDQYRAVILGSAVYAGKWLPEARYFAEHYRKELSERPVWVFSSGPLGEENPQRHDDPAKLAEPLGEVPIKDHHIFVGRLNASDLNFGERIITRILKAPLGDFRDWTEIKEWAQEIVNSLMVTPPSPTVQSSAQA